MSVILLKYSVHYPICAQSKTTVDREAQIVLAVLSVDSMSFFICLGLLREHMFLIEIQALCSIAIFFLVGFSVKCCIITALYRHLFRNFRLIGYFHFKDTAMKKAL